MLMIRFKISMASQQYFVFQWAIFFPNRSVCVCTFSGESIVLFCGFLCACAFSGRSVYLCLLWLLYCYFWWVYLYLCNLRQVCMSVPSPVALLFIPIGLFILMPSSIGLYICTFSYCSMILFNVSICAYAFSGGSVCLYLLQLLYYSF